MPLRTIKIIFSYFCCENLFYQMAFYFFIFLSHMYYHLTESYNAILIEKGMDQKERMIELRKLARTQLMSLGKLNDSGIKKLEGKK